MSTKTFEASSVEEALAAAASELGVDADSLTYESEEKASDFWGLGDTVYAVTVTLPVAEEPEPAPEPAPEPESVETPESASEPAPEAAQADEVSAEEPSAEQREELPPFFSGDADEDPSSTETDPVPEPESAPETVESAPAEAPAAEERDAEPSGGDEPVPAAAEDAAPEANGAATGDGQDLTAEATEILDRIFSAMGFECTAEAKLDGETMHVAITGEDNQYLLEGRGRGLAALELILNHSFRAFSDRAHKRVRVDAGDFRSKRDDEIRDMAYQVAHRAKETGEEQQTSELNPYERRIVHLTLADDSRVTTRSLGNGFLKAVNVIPTGGGRRN